MDWAEDNNKFDCVFYSFNAIVGVNCLDSLTLALQKKAKLSSEAFMQNVTTYQGVKLKHLPQVPVVTNICNVLERTWVEIKNVFEDNGACARLMRKTGAHAEILLDYIVPTKRGMLRIDSV